MTTIKIYDTKQTVCVDTLPYKFSQETKAILDSNPELALAGTLRMMYEDSSKHTSNPKEVMKKIVNDLVFDLKQMPGYRTRTIRSLKKIDRKSVV